jgi:hypothetical protein
MALLAGFTTRYSTTLLAAIPLFVMAIGLVLLDRMYPIYINSNTGLGQDPAYQYLFAGIDILQGHSPAHTDHPGTPLQTLIAAVIALVWCFLHSFALTDLGLFDTVLLRPELFLLATSCVLLGLTVTALFYFGRRIFDNTQSLATAIACQFSPLVYAMVIPNLVFPTPEALLISISVTLMGVLTPIVLNRTKPSELKATTAAHWAGILCGLGLATKLTFMPVLGLLLLFKNPFLIFRASVFCLLAWLIGVLPIWPRLGTMFRWFYSLLTHSGIHGSGSNEIFNLQHIKTALGWLFTRFSLFYGVVFFLISVVSLALLVHLFNWIRARRSIHSSLVKLPYLFTRPCCRADLVSAGIFCGVLVGQTLIVTKHLGPTYMIPALPLPLLAFAWLVHGQRTIPISKPIVKILAICWLSLIVITAAASISSSVSAVSRTHQKGLQSHQVIEEQLKQFDNPLLIGAFNCNFAECALWFGIGLVPAMELRMGAVAPNFYYFDVFGKKIHLPGIGELSDQQTSDTITSLTQTGRPIVLISPPYPQLNKLKLELVVTTPVQNLYRVLGMAEPIMTR